MVTDARTCTATRRDGTPCKAQATTSTGHCWAHDPEGQERLASARSAGGRARARTARAEKLMPTVLKPVLHALLDALGKVKQSQITPQQASATAALAGAIVRVYEAGMLEERLQALESVQTPGTTARRRGA